MMLTNPSVFSATLTVLSFAVLPVITATNNTTWPVQTYKTANFTPPVLEISHHTSQRHGRPTKWNDPAEGYLFFAPDGTPQLNPDSAPLIMDMNGELIWNGPAGHAFAFGVQTYRGEPVLVSWNGTVFPEPVGRGNGAVYLWNKHYEQIAVVTLPGNFLELTPGASYPSNIDLHEIYLTKNGTVLVTGNNVTQTDLRSVGGPEDGWVVEAQVYEIDIATNEVLFSWKSLDHLDDIPLTASLYPLGSEGYDGKTQSHAWGYFHPNAVSPYEGGGYLISARYLCSAIMIDAAGAVQWRLQGRDGGDFTLGEGVDFCYQHDIRMVEATHDKHGSCTGVMLQMHDNHNCPIDNDTVPASGKVLDVDLVSKHVTLEQKFINDTGPIFPTAQGSFQRLGNGNVFIGHGWVPVMEEFSPIGRILSTIQFGTTPKRPGGGFFSSPTTAVTLSYRSLKSSWIGCPKTKPAVVAHSTANGTAVYISWNGATEVKGWAVYGGNETVSHITTVAKTGFETVVSLSSLQSVQVKPVLGTGAAQDCGQNVTSDVIFVYAA